MRGSNRALEASVFRSTGPVKLEESAGLGVLGFGTELYLPGYKIRPFWYLFGRWYHHAS